LAAISGELREFFHKDGNNSIEFWNCLSNHNWSLHDIVDKETKKFVLTPTFPCKSSWDFSKKNKCDSILNTWKMSFQVSDDKGRNFLELLDNDSKPIESRHHILHSCRRFNNYWNPRRDSIAHFMLFLEFNSNTFTFDDRIT